MKLLNILSGKCESHGEAAPLFVFPAPPESSCISGAVVGVTDEKLLLSIFPGDYRFKLH